MNTEQTKHNEELNKSIDALLDEVFSEVVEKGSPLDLASDNKTTADAVMSQVPGSQKDESRGAGRPKQISDVPQNDMDGRRDSQYDASITENDGKEDEPEEAKKQSKAVDQVSKEGHMAQSPKAPQSRPFKKSEDGTSVELSEKEYAEFQAFKKSQVEAAEKAKQTEELKKAESVKKEQEELVKSAIAKATDALRKENDDLRKSVSETNALIKAMASQPVRSKSITGIDVLEKGTSDENKAPETFSKSEILDAAFELAKSGKISDTIVAEIEMTNRCSDAESRAKIEKYLEGKK